MSLTLTSTAFTDGSDIPIRFTCDGENVSPPLSWSNVPPNAKSLALIVEDPDAPDPAAPERIFVHWVLYNLPAHDSGLKQNVAVEGMPTGTKEGLNDWRKAGYGGPCPPVGRHRYFHRLYALDIVLPELNNPDKAKLEEAMQGHIVDEATLMGFYQH
jgi:Raf kinase inhibitor-like YbhB/YbcL family protein